MKIPWLFVLFALAAQLSLVAADDEPSVVVPEVDTSKWKCRKCAFEEGWRLDMTLGPGYVSDDSYKFGEYNGLNEEGVYLIGDADLSYRNEDADYVDISISDIGLDSRSLAIEGGRQGSYKLFLDYNEIPRFISDSVSTPYLGSGSDDLTLPSDWVNAGTTGGMTKLQASLQDVNLGTQRKRLGAGLALTPDSPWGYQVKVRHDNKEGTERMAGSFFFDSAQLVEPIDYITDELDASVSYTTKQWQAKIAYYGSVFSNKNESLSWENPYTPIVVDADDGQLALPPDNQFHQLTLSTAYQVSDRSHFSGHIAFGHMEQNEKLLQTTQNTSLVVPPLPADSANAKVETTDAKLKFISMQTDKLRLSATYTHTDRDNKTPQRTYDWVTTDAFLAGQRTNLPYSFTKDLVKLKADYKYARGTKLGFGYETEESERTFQEVEKTRENTLSVTMRQRNIDNLLLEFKFAHSERDTSSSQVVSEIDPPENILMSKYNTADRSRNSVGFYASVTPQSHYSIGINLDFSRDDYDKSVLGLTDSQDTSLNIDLTTMLSENTTASFFVGRETISSKQAGSQTFANADWFVRNDDTFDNIGFSVTHIVIQNTLEIGADFTMARSTGEIALNSGGPVEPFPDLRTELDRVKLYANYQLDEALSLRVAYWYESYDSSNWAVDDVAADTVPNLLSFGELNPSYDVNVIELAMHYRF